MKFCGNFSTTVLSLLDADNTPTENQTWSVLARRLKSGKGLARSCIYRNKSQTKQFVHFGLHASNKNNGTSAENGEK